MHDRRAVALLVDAAAQRVARVLGVAKHHDRRLLVREDREQLGELLIVLAELDHLRDAVDCLHVAVADRNVGRIAQVVARELLDLERPAGGRAGGREREIWEMGRDIR